jgi:hypothetical protein
MGDFAYNASTSSFHSAHCATLRTGRDRHVLSPSVTVAKKRLSFPRRAPRWGRLLALRTRKEKMTWWPPGRGNKEPYWSPVVGATVGFLSVGDW